MFIQLNVTLKAHLNITLLSWISFEEMVLQRFPLISIVLIHLFVQQLVKSEQHLMTIVY